MFTSPIHPCVRVPARVRAQDHCNCFISLSGMLFVTANIREDWPRAHAHAHAR